jgi:choline dehydrogenase-like flavoprotein
LENSDDKSGIIYLQPVPHSTYGLREDYDSWERAGNPGWGWDSVLPYFIKSEVKCAECEKMTFSHICTVVNTLVT